MDLVLDHKIQARCEDKERKMVPEVTVSHCRTFGDRDGVYGGHCRLRELRSQGEFMVFTRLSSPGSILDEVLGSSLWNTALLLCRQVPEGYREKTRAYPSSRKLASLHSWFFVAVKKTVPIGYQDFGRVKRVVFAFHFPHILFFIIPYVLIQKFLCLLPVGML